jgi:HEAT repeat protein
LLAAVDDPDAAARYGAFRALGAIADPRAIPRLQELLDAGVEPVMARWALDRIAERGRGGAD